ncbi:MAG TPA: hypothetical protein VIG67_03735 [Yaniella sp.]
MMETFRFALLGLRQWGRRQYQVALLAAVVVGLLIGIATVLIPNPWFARDIEPVWWNYPVWIVTAAITGMLFATYVKLDPSKVEPVEVPAKQQSSTQTDEKTSEQKDSYGKMGMVGGMLSWFAVGCPVCNKLALLAFGYSGAITYFTPIQPFLAIAALLLTTGALVWRLKGQVVCSVPLPRRQGADDSTEMLGVDL